MAEHVTTTEGGGHTVVVRQCPLCTRISPHAHGFMGLHDGQPFCDRCLDDLAALIKERRGRLMAERVPLGDHLWPIGALFHGVKPPAHGQWVRLEPTPYAPGPIWQRTI